VPILPADAGTLEFSVGNALSALGNVLSAPGSGGLGATIDVSATNLTITAAAANASGVTLSAPVVQGWAAGTLVLGGQLSSSPTGDSINVTADSVTVGAGATLSANQILAVANQDIDVQAGAKLASSSGISGTALSALPMSVPLTLSGSGAAGAAVLALSDLQLPVTERSAGNPSASAATIQVESGSTLSTRGALAIDAPGTVSIAGSVDAAGASWSLGSSGVAFVAAGSQSADTLQIGSGLLSAMQQAGALRIDSAGPIDLLTPISLGAASASSAPSFQNLTLIGTAVNNFAAGSSLLAGETLSLQAAGGAGATPMNGAGTLTLLANEIDLGPGTLAVNGFSQTDAIVSGPIIGQGAGGLLLGGNATLTAAELTAAAGSSTSLSAPGGTLTLIGSPSKTASSLPVELGGQLSLSAQTLQIQGSLNAPGGNITMQASGDVALSDNAQVNTAGASVTVADQTAGGAGGNIIITGGGDVSLPTGTSINVAGAGAAPAGSLAVTAGGTLTLGAALSGTAAAGAIGGSLAVDAGALSGGLPALASSLASSGFSNAINVRVRSGDLDLPGGSQLSANAVSLVADAGAIDIAGTVSAPTAGTRGSIGMYAANGIALESGAGLHADGAGAGGRGGNIVLSTSGGALSLGSGATITMAGAAEPGNLLLQAPVAGADDVAITTLAADVGGVGQVTVEPVQLFTVSASPSSSQLNGILADVSSYMSAAGTQIATRLALPSGDAPLIIEPGVQLQTPGALTLAQGLNLGSWRFMSGEPAAVANAGGAPVDLTLRAGGDIDILKSVTDGLTTQAGQTMLSGGPSSTMRFVAGADLTSADPLAVVAGSGANLTLAKGTVVTTGTGDIDLIASGDVVFAGAGSSAYTTGIPGTAVPGIPVRISQGKSRTFSFPTDGGNLWINAGQDIVGGAVTQSIAQWQIRQGNQSNDAQYGVDLNQFGWNLGTLGGGDLRVQAGRDIVNLSAAAADSYVDAANATSGSATEFNSGGLTVIAGRDVLSGQFSIGTGVGTLTAGGAFGSDLSDGSANPVGSLIALENSQVSLWARNDIDLAAVINPTALPEPNVTTAALRGEFFSYSQSSALSAQSTAGTVTVNDTPLTAQVLTGAPSSSDADAFDVAMAVLPASLTLTALTQDINIPNYPTVNTAAYLYPSDNGELSLFAGRDIIGNSQGGAPLIMSDAFDAGLPTVLNPGAGGTVAVSDASGRHSNDPTPIFVTAGRDIVSLGLGAPKQSEIQAGRDIVNLAMGGQNLNPGDMTLISAGRDITWSSTQDVGGVQIGGPGSLVMLADRNVDLGISSGVSTVGDLDNPNLPTSAGASVTIMAGLGADPAYGAFLTKIVEPSAAYQAELQSYVESLSGQSDLSVAQADSMFSALSIQQQRPLLNGIFFSALNASGLQANADPAVGFTQGYAAIDTLFPDSRTAVQAPGTTDPYSGDLTLVFSRVYTIQGGGISLFAPGGLVNVGLANPPASLASRPASELGIVAQGAGDVDIYSKGDVLVSQSRIFTLGGGNILIWSDEGNIDAGNGAKSSLSVPPPQILVDASGNVTLDLTGAVAGSGIRTIQIDPSVPAGNVDLIAPEGIVNAGDAGIGAAGNINIAAVQVIGASNINFGGSATGVPATVSNIGASLSGASSVAASTTTSATASATAASENAENAAPLAQAAISWLDVFVTGLGEENCRPDDMECLKRQKKE
jgi:hypothetical protein